ncbi:hypothetical protein BB559_006240 [Furculomyces boomerangus]|uniref:PUM-HD domain-containing protein n=1 Tax=Furculomyces boomerangus TaxID=61424 RepID=A0A2T9Y489_9FUNG|nr:hypothetical protein BB559_006240 [Furculomyces boomerangus]
MAISTKKRKAPAQKQTQPKPKKSSVTVETPVKDNDSDSELESDSESSSETELIDQESPDETIENAEEKVNAKPTKYLNTQASKDKNKEQKELKDKRKALKPDYELIRELKRKWELMRRRDNPMEKRQEAVKEALDMIKGKIKEVTFKHDCSRIIQSVLKVGDLKQRNLVAEELKDSFLELSTKKYGKYIVIRILRYCPSYREKVISSFYGNVQKMIRLKESAVVLEEIYTSWANSEQQSSLIQEFYGNEYAIFKNSSKSKKISDIIANSPEKKATVLSNLKKVIHSLLNKETVQKSIVHKCILDYLTYADFNEAQELSSLLKENIVEILHTKDGAKAGMLCFFYATPKDRKSILKTFKEYMHKICCEEYGHWVLLAALESVDDTVLMGKTVIQDLSAMIDKLANDKFGRRVLLHILCGRDGRYVGSDAIQMLKFGDSIRAKTSKKDDNVRRSELVKSISPKLLEWVEKNASKSVSIPFESQLLTETILNCKGEKQTAVESLCSVLKNLNDEQTPKTNKKSTGYQKLDESYILMDKTSCRVFTSIVKSDYKQKLEEVGQNSPSLGNLVLDSILNVPDLLPRLAVSGVFLVVDLLESPLTKERTKKELGNIHKQLASLKELKIDEEGHEKKKRKVEEKSEKAVKLSVNDIIMKLLVKN